MPFNYEFPHYPEYDTTKYLISLVGCSPMNIGLSLKWLQEISYLLKFPALLLVSEVSPIISQQTAGTNTVIIDGRRDIKSIKNALASWLRGELLPSENCKRTIPLNAQEWDVLNCYLRVHDMFAVSRWMDMPIKTAYYWRKSTLLKLGFNHINDFLRFYPVSSPCQSECYIS